MFEAYKKSINITNTCKIAKKYRRLVIVYFFQVRKETVLALILFNMQTVGGI